MTMPLRTLRDEAKSTLPVWQRLRVSARLAAASGFPATFGTVQTAGAFREIEKLCDTAGAAL